MPSRDASMVMLDVIVAFMFSALCAVSILVTMAKETRC